MIDNMSDKLDKAINEVSNEWVQELVDKIQLGEEGADSLNLLVAPVMLPLALVKMYMEEAGNEWDLYEAVEYLGDDIINSLSLLEDVEIVDLEVEAHNPDEYVTPDVVIPQQGVDSTPKKAAKKAPKKDTTKKAKKVEANVEGKE